MSKFIRITVSGEPDLINISNIVRIRKRHVGDISNLCEIITTNGIVRPDESFDKVKDTLSRCCEISFTV